jgi:predicted DNA-binding ribbon-helix-helix protein
MCHVFASQPPESYAFETRSVRINGQSTSIRLEKMFWDVLEQIAREQGFTVPRFVSTLHSEILELRGEAPNFTSHLRCICLVFLSKGGREAETVAAEAAA